MKQAIIQIKEHHYSGGGNMAYISVPHDYDFNLNDYGDCHTVCVDYWKLHSENSHCQVVCNVEIHTKNETISDYIKLGKCRGKYDNNTWGLHWVRSYDGVDVFQIDIKRYIRLGNSHAWSLLCNLRHLDPAEDTCGYIKYKYLIGDYD